MNFTFTHRPEIRKYNYKPQFYVPDEEKSTNVQNFDPDKFGDKLRSNWDRKRHNKSSRQGNTRIILWMAFIIIVLLFVGYKFLF